MREKIEITELLAVNGATQLHDLVGFTWVDETQVSFDSEKGSADFKTIIKRMSDGKYFKVEWTDYCYKNNLDECIGEEVYLEESVVIVYK